VMSGLTWRLAVSGLGGLAIFRARAQGEIVGAAGGGFFPQIGTQNCFEPRARFYFR
jgi:hypothetical protein